MNNGPMKVAVVIPALNEQAALPLVLADLPWSLLERVVVADNGSTDDTAALAKSGGAEVVHEARRGYGSACLAGLAHLEAAPPEVVVFLDADYSDHPEELSALIAPIRDEQVEMVIGSRVLGNREAGALLPQARVGNWLACTLLRWLYRVHYTDLGPFRAIRWSSLRALEMVDTNYGWTVEMQVKAARRGLPYMEVPVSYRRRVGKSKITGTIRGTLSAGTKILWTIFRYARS